MNRIEKVNKIEVRHSSIVIRDYTWNDAPTIEEFYTLYDKVTHSYYTRGILYDEEKKILYLPRGMDICLVEKYIGCNATVIKKSDPVDVVAPIGLRYLPRDEVQEEAVRFYLGHAEYSYTKSKSQLAINLNPGEGKTYLSIAAAAFFQVRTAMITSSLDWISQWKDRIQEYTDTKPNEIYILSGVGSIARLLNGMVDKNKLKFILISHRTLSSYGDTYGWDKVGELFYFLGLGLKIYDEAHLDFDNICRIDYSTNTKKSIYLTGTPGLSDRKANRIYQSYFRNVPAIDLFDEDRDPRTHYLAIFYNSHPSAQDIARCRGSHGFDMHKYVDYVIGRPNFFKLVYVLAEIIKKKGKTLIFIGKNQVALILFQWMEYWIPEFRGQIGLYNSTIPKDQKEEQLDKLVILSTIKSCGTAKDIKGLQLTIVLAEPFNSDILAKQTLGRTREYDTLYIDIVDIGFAAIKNYYRSKQDLFHTYALSCTDMKLDDITLDNKVQDILIARQNWYNSFTQQEDLQVIVDRVPKSEEEK